VLTLFGALLVPRTIYSRRCITSVYSSKPLWPLTSARDTGGQREQRRRRLQLGEDADVVQDPVREGDAIQDQIPGPLRVRLCLIRATGQRSQLAGVVRGDRVLLGEVVVGRLDDAQPDDSRRQEPQDVVLERQVKAYRGDSELEGPVRCRRQVDPSSQEVDLLGGCFVLWAGHGPSFVANYGGSARTATSASPDRM
jgi:hypothetical protein